MELFFKWIEQNLIIKTFPGTSRNAVITQTWIALCVYLLLSFIKLSAAAAGFAPCCYPASIGPE